MILKLLKLHWYLRSLILIVILFLRLPLFLFVSKLSDLISFVDNYLIIIIITEILKLFTVILEVLVIVENALEWLFWNMLQLLLLLLLQSRFTIASNIWEAAWLDVFKFFWQFTFTHKLLHKTVFTKQSKRHFYNFKFINNFI